MEAKYVDGSDMPLAEGDGNGSAKAHSGDQEGRG